MAPEINWHRYGTRNYVTVTLRIMGLIQQCSTEHWDITATAVSRAEHSNSRFESIRFVKKSAFRFTSCHAVFLAYLLYSLSQKSKLTLLYAAFIL